MVLSELTEAFNYLDDLRESVTTNMFGAASYLSADYAIDAKLARRILASWMDTFDDRDPEDRASEALSQFEAD